MCMSQALWLNLFAGLNTHFDIKDVELAFDLPLFVEGSNPLAVRRMVPSEVSALQAPNSLQNTPLHHITPTAHHRHLSAVMSTDIDSDTNSHCALLIPEDAIKQGKLGRLRSVGYVSYTCLGLGVITTVHLMLTF